MGLFVSGNLGGAAMQWHFRFGYTVAGLLFFRLIWGFVGGHWSRFSSFFFGPRRIVAYLRGRGDPVWTVGHNPLGSLSVFAMLAVLAAQVGSGLMSDDEIAWHGPLTQWVGATWIESATAYHKHIGKPLIIGLVVLHLLAIAYHQTVKRERLVRAMLTGDKHVALDAPASADGLRARLLGLILLTLCVAVAVGTLASLE
ncbi:MAG: hypothetical protein OHK0048_26340 [Rhodoferax sp.]